MQLTAAANELVFLQVNTTTGQVSIQNQTGETVHVTPTYVAVTGRPDGVGGLGIQFNAAQQEYLHGPNLNWPDVSFSSIEGNGTLNYTGIVDRGLQFWVRPASTAVQSLVMDSNDHGARINSSGNFSMRYFGSDYDSSTAVAANTWYHVMVVRPQGPANGSRMYVNGVAVAAAPGDYGSDSAHLVVGANTDGDDLSFTGGTAEFFSGIIDDLKLFVIGTSTATDTHPSVNWGSFNLGTENEYIDWFLTGVPGDVNNDGSLTQTDKDAFIAGWMDRKLINGLQVGDLTTFGQGDLNFDGVTNIHDLVLMQAALPGAGLAAITAVELQGAVPEPGTALLALLAFGWLPIYARVRG